jgi:DNA repair protein
LSVSENLEHRDKFERSEFPNRKNEHFYMTLPIKLQQSIVDFLPPKTLLVCLRAQLPVFTDLCWRAYWTEKINANSPARRISNVTGANFTYLANSLCFECGKATTRKAHFYDFFVCAPCSQADNTRYELITKSRARTEFCLTEKEVQTSFESIAVPNPHYRAGPPMTLFLLSDVKAFAVTKYGSSQGLVEEQNRRKENRERKQIAREDRMEERRVALRDALARVGLEIRPDSRLCQGFINNTLEAHWTLDKVVEMIAEMRWLHEYTPYRDELNRAVTDYAGYLRQDMRWADAFPMAHEECEPDVRRSILQRFPRPEIWPWII